MSIEDILKDSIVEGYASTKVTLTLPLCSVKGNLRYSTMTVGRSAFFCISHNSFFCSVVSGMSFCRITSKAVCSWMLYSDAAFLNIICVENIILMEE